MQRRRLHRVVILVLAFVGCSEDQPRRDLASVQPCEPTRPPPSQPTPKPAPAAKQDNSWWCLATPNEIATCDRTREICEKRRRDAMAKYDDWDKACEATEKVVCWTRENKLDAQRIESYCYASFTICNNMRDNTMRGWEADWTIVRDCTAESAGAAHVPDASREASPDDRASEKRPSVFLVVRSFLSGRELKVAVADGQQTAVFDSGWSCSVENPLITHPAVGSKRPTIPFDMYVHSAQCVRGDAAVGFSLECPTTLANLAAHKSARDVLTLAEMVILIVERPREQEDRFFVTLLCE